MGWLSFTIITIDRLPAPQTSCACCSVYGKYEGNPDRWLVKAPSLLLTGAPLHPRPLTDTRRAARDAQTSAENTANHTGGNMSRKVWPFHRKKPQCVNIQEQVSGAIYIYEWSRYSPLRWTVQEVPCVRMNDNMSVTGLGVSTLLNFSKELNNQCVFMSFTCCRV